MWDEVNIHSVDVIQDLYLATPSALDGSLSSEKSSLVVSTDIYKLTFIFKWIRVLKFISETQNFTLLVCTL